ncbi:MAG: HD domain-containing phosphohydrolase [Desulfitobacterium sp.]
MQKTKKNYKYEPLRLCLTYLLLGALLIFVINSIAANLRLNNHEVFDGMSIYIGWVYLLGTTPIIYYILHRNFKSMVQADLAEEKLQKGNQELLATYEELEAMNEEIKQQYDELRIYSTELAINRDRLKRAQAIAHVGNGEITLATKEMWASEESFRIYGFPYDSPILPLQVAQELVQKKDRSKMDEALQKLIKLDERYDVKFRINRQSDGEERILHSVAILDRDSDGTPLKVIGVLQDVTEQERTEEQMRFYAEHDIITGLHNRWYFEQEIVDIMINAKSVGIIMCDIDGLKLINDTLGEEAGDQYLVAFANILKEACPPEGVVARIGGDEFTIVLKDTAEEEVEQIYRLINTGVEHFNRKKLSMLLSISMGVCYRELCERETLPNVLKEAEEQMNFHKLLQGQSTRSKTVDILMKTLEARDYITEGHSDRLQQMMVEVGKRVGMDELEKSRLTLFACFHDIGKVGIPDSILFKPGKLDKEEFEEMKKHSEIGYRIANASPDLAYISDFILKHHEWWNGQGYPLGLDGEEIPLECRILSIADAYDSMSNDRPYRKAMAYEDRIDELRRFSGIQFDPNLVAIFIDLLNESPEDGGITT